MKTYLLLSILSVFFLSCRKQVTESNISGTYKLDAIKLMRAFSRERVEHPLLGATFIFNNAGQVKCITASDTLNGTYYFQQRNVQNNDQDGLLNNNRQNGIFMYLINGSNTNRISIVLWNVRYRDNRSEIIGEEERVRNNYQFHFTRQ